MKPMTLSPIRTAPKSNEKTRLERVWVMENGRPTCRWIPSAK